jgi:putative transposase
MFYMTFFDPDAFLVIHRGKLLHWRQQGVTYFVTFHLADSLPQAKLAQMKTKKIVEISPDIGVQGSTF